MEECLILDDVVDKPMQDDIERKVYNFPWFIGSEIKQDLSPVDVTSVMYNLIYHHKDKRAFTEAYDLLSPLCYSIVDKSGLKFREFLQIRLAAHFPIITDRKLNYIHVDIDDFSDYFTAVYYINDSDDAPTVIYDQTNRNSTADKRYFLGDLTESHRIDAIKGRCVVFPGAKYHAGIIPSCNTKIILNLSWR